MALDTDGTQKSVRQLRKLLKNPPRQPTPDEIHSLRTHTRRFESTLDALGLDSKRNERRALRDLSRLRGRAGKIRDMDVLTAHAVTVHPDQEQDCLVRLLEYLGAERYRRAEQLHTLTLQYGAAVRRRLKRTSARLKRFIEDDGEKSSARRNTASTEAMARALKLSSELTTPATLNRNNLHAYRLKVKELRDVLQMANDSDNRKFIYRLGEIKDAIGEWHDWEELTAIAMDVLDHGANCNLLRELKAISARKYESGLSLTNKMRREYLHSCAGTKKHVPTGKLRPAQPVLEATSAIAS